MKSESQCPREAEAGFSEIRKFCNARLIAVDRIGPPRLPWHLSLGNVGYWKPSVRMNLSA
jgi:hypothetical protein